MNILLKTSGIPLSTRFHTPSTTGSHYEQRSLLGQPQRCERYSQILTLSSPRRKEKGAESLLKEITAENFLNLERNRHPDLRNTEIVKDESKETHTKTHYIEIEKVKDKERFLKGAKKKNLLHIREPS